MQPDEPRPSKQTKVRKTKANQTSGIQEQGTKTLKARCRRHGVALVRNREGTMFTPPTTSLPPSTPYEKHVPILIRYSLQFLHKQFLQQCRGGLQSRQMLIRVQEKDVFGVVVRKTCASHDDRAPCHGKKAKMPPDAAVRLPRQNFSRVIFGLQRLFFCRWRP